MVINMRKLIEKLSGLRGISGRETRVSEEIAALLTPYCDSVMTDPLGSVIAYRSCGRKNAPSVLIEAHIDEIGLMVSSVCENGALRFVNVGGVDERILPSLEVTVHGAEDIPGVIGFMPAERTDASKSYKLSELVIDTGLKAERVRELVKTGDPVTLPQSVGALGKHQISSKTMDDRASAAALVSVMKRLKDEKLCCDVYLAAAVQEEVGCRGGKTTAYSVMPDMAVAVDVTHGITPDNERNAFKTGSGAVISKGPNLHPRLTERLIKTARENGIKYCVDADGGNTGTDAWEIQVSGPGIPAALLSIPLKYMHTSVETLDVRDVKAVTELLTLFIKGLESDISWLSL